MSFQAAWQALERDDFRFAENIAREALGRSPGDGEALYLLGSTLLFEGRHREALAPLLQAAAVLARRGVRYRLGHCHLALGELELAEQALRAETLARSSTISSPIAPSSRPAPWPTTAKTSSGCPTATK